MVSSRQVPWEDVGWCWSGHHGDVLRFGEASYRVSSRQPRFNTAQSSGDGAAAYPPTQNNAARAQRHDPNPKSTQVTSHPSAAAGGHERALRTVLPHLCQHSPLRAGWGMSCAATTSLQK